MRLQRAAVLVLATISTYSAEAMDVTLPSVRAYGFVLPNVTVSSQGAESFNQPNMSAPTAAGNPGVANGVNPRMSFQAAQSRIGFAISEKEKASAKIELDFIDFTKSSPTTTALPRLRIAKVQYQASANDLVSLGQDWDLFSPLAPHTYNLVGHYFQSGDAGFMRHQLTWLHAMGEYEMGFALGMSANNSTSRDTNLEISGTPSASFRLKRAISGKDQLGISAIYSSFLLDTRRDAYAGNIFYEYVSSPKFSLRSEAYYGQNMANIILQTLSYGSVAGGNVQEAGGFATAKYTCDGGVGIFGGGGYAAVLNPGYSIAGYTSTVAGAGTNSGTGPGILNNVTGRIGFDYKLESNLTLFIEESYFQTQHKLASLDVANNVNPNVNTFITTSGMMLTF